MPLLPLLLTLDIEAHPGLIERLQRRDPQALAELYDRYGRLVYALILRVVRDTGVAEDLVQETFLRVWNRAQGLDAGKGSLGPWLMAVARNRAIDYLRYQGRRAESVIELNETEHPSLFVGEMPNPLQIDFVRQVKEAMAALSGEQRQAIELAYFEGLSQSEIAERMGQPLGTVKTWMRRALQQMRAALEGVEGAA